MPNTKDRLVLSSEKLGLSHAQALNSSEVLFSHSSVCCACMLHSLIAENCIMICFAGGVLLTLS